MPWDEAGNVVASKALRSISSKQSVCSHTCTPRWLSNHLVCHSEAWDSPPCLSLKHRQRKLQQIASPPLPAFEPIFAASSAHSSSAKISQDASLPTGIPFKKQSKWESFLKRCWLYDRHRTPTPFSLPWVCICKLQEKNSVPWRMNRRFTFRISSATLYLLPWEDLCFLYGGLSPSELNQESHLVLCVQY